MYINMDVKEIGFDIMYVIRLGQDRAHSRTVVKTTIKLGIFFMVKFLYSFV
jgi:hypothetical protein